ncbi:hypothetical protein HDV02_001504 [Globomyces sp. JEL0801]|nr:hypothetical protein HDV02_001504 [Globomyces sp. JEL0801]
MSTYDTSSYQNFIQDFINDKDSRIAQNSYAHLLHHEMPDLSDLDQLELEEESQYYDQNHPEDDLLQDEEFHVNMQKLDEELSLLNLSYDQQNYNTDHDFNNIQQSPNHRMDTPNNDKLQSTALSDGLISISSNVAPNSTITTDADIQDYHKSITRSNSVETVTETPVDIQLKPNDNDSNMFTQPRLSQTSNDIRNYQIPRKNSFEGYLQSPLQHGDIVPNHVHGLLLDAENESRSLRILNERLVIANTEYQQKIDRLELEMERIQFDNQKSIEQAIQSTIQSNIERQQKSDEIISKLRDELETSKKSVDHLTTIRRTIEREKELDILEMKKNLLSEKEKTLYELRNEMAQQRQRLQSDYERQINEERAKSRDTYAEFKQFQQDIIGVLSPVVNMPVERQSISARVVLQMVETVVEHTSKVTAQMHRQMQSESQIQEQTNNAVQQMEMQQKDIIQQLEQKHKEALDSLIKAHEDNIAIQNKQLVEMEKKYQLQLESAKSNQKFESENYERLLHELKKQHQMAFETNSETYQLQINNLKHQLETLRETLEAEHSKTLQNLSQAFKKECTKAYDKAIGKLKHEYGRLEEDLNRQCNMKVEALETELSRTKSKCKEKIQYLQVNFKRFIFRTN